MLIDDIKKELEKQKDKKAFLKQKLDEEQDFDLKSEIRKLYIEELRKSSIVKLDTYENGEFRLVYDAIGEGLEPIYFWVLDFMRSDEPTGLGLEVSKVEEAFESTASSGFFGEMGTRRSVMEDRAMKMLQMVNTVVRSIINLIYDLKEFKQRISFYDKVKSQDSKIVEEGEIGLKGIWLDQVDLQKGRASINVLTQQLQFFTLRDAFFAAKSVNDARDLDLNDRVKRILIRKLSEFYDWKQLSEQEIRKRYSIELQYLKTQVDSLKLYTKWARPYLRAAQQLRMKEFNSPDLVAAFDNMIMELRLFGKKEVKPMSVYEEYQRIKFGKKYYACIEINFKFRTIPQALRTQQGSQYVHTGTTEMTFKAFTFSDDELNELEAQELYEDMDLVEQLTSVSLKALQEDIKEFLNEKKEEKKEEKKKPLFAVPKIPVLSALKGFWDALKNINKGLMEFFKLQGPEKYTYETKQVKKKAEETALKNVFVVYDVYKKTHGMLSW
ncbi:hypothetical protein HYX18_00670 [Candidatus Woesearchaeota archaeon]|nr:hypothetical protein [Candidatus Woesearchaeota archaeon]